MIKSVTISNYKSIEHLNLPLGRVNVLIGENGAGKSNILEAIALASAAATDHLENEFLASRGIRVSDPELMRAAFDENDEDIKVEVVPSSGEAIPISLGLDTSKSTPRWKERDQLSVQERLANPSEETIEKSLTQFIGPLLKEDEVKGFIAEHGEAFAREYAAAKETGVANDELLLKVMSRLPEEFVVGVIGAMLMSTLNPLTEGFKRQLAIGRNKDLNRFIIFSPAYSTLRTFQAEGQILPLGIRGEGLFSHLKALSEADPQRLHDISCRLDLLDWFEQMEIQPNPAPFETKLDIRDRYLGEQQLFDQRSVNEGFFFVLFYLTLLLSPDTPRFLAIDNVDASLNPKLCHHLIKEMVTLAKEQNRQIILTTHNPAVLDGLNLHDDEQVLFVVKRNADGRTIAQRVPPPKSSKRPIKLSEAFMRGYIGGLPENF